MSKTRWPQQNAVILADPRGSIALMLKELLRYQGWRVIDSTDSLRICIEAIHFGEANFLVIDDLGDVPSSFVLRRMFMDRVACLTPTLVFTNEGQVAARTAMTRIGATGVVPKPMTPDKFLPVFNDVLQTWSTESFVKVRTAAHQITHSQEESGLRLLTSLSGDPDVGPIVAPCVARYLFNNGSVKAAEKVLLESLRGSPRNLGVILTLSEFYLKAGMPEMAYKILNGVRRTYQNSLALIPDLLAACLLLDRLELAVALLKNMAEKNFLLKDTADFLSRCLISEGRLGELRKLGLGRPYLRELENCWEEDILSELAAS